MLQKAVYLFVVIIISSMTLIAQERMVMRPDGKFYRFNGNENSFEVMKIKPNTNKQQIRSTVKNPISANGIIDTLGYNDGTFNTDFGSFGQDWMLQWFVAPADLIIKGFAFLATDNSGLLNGAYLESKIVKVNLTEDQLLITPAERDGYYQASGNGYNNITAFLDNPDRTGGWTSISGDPEPFGSDIWSDGGFSVPIVPFDTGQYVWMQTNIKFEPNIFQGEIFGIAYRNTGANMDTDRISLRSGIIGIPGWKFYANGRFNPGVDYGWWSLEYTWDILVEVELLNTSDNQEDISSNPNEFRLDQNYPNPYNPSTKISWQSPAGSWQTLKIYDVLGNEVATLVDEYKPAGRYEVEFDSHSNKGQNLSSGVYFYQLKAGSYIQTRKMILIR
ncbi:MAG: T9SS type A sorting domain-containing protein [Ignavibacteriales bacterium]|nr:T9SS type A sorting domain-containing protein [Ignavibacteriales bacterium]